MGFLRDFVNKRKITIIVNEIEAGKLNYIDENVCNPDDLKYNYGNGVALLDYIAGGDVKVSDELMNKFLSNPVNFVYVVSKPYSYHFLANRKVSEDFLNEIVDGKTVFDHLKEHSVCLEIDYSDINNLDFIDKFAHDFIYFPRNVNAKLFNRLLEKDGENYLLDKYLENKPLFTWIVSNITDVKIYDYLLSKNLSAEYLHALNYEVLLHPINDVTVFDEVKDKVESFDVMNVIPPDKDFINLLIKNGRYDKLINCKEETLLTFIEPNYTLLEHLIDNGKLEYYNHYINDPRTIDIAIKKGRTDIIKAVTNECYVKLSDNYTKGTVLPDIFSSDLNCFEIINKLSTADINKLVDKKEYIILSNFLYSLKDKVLDDKYLIDLLLDNNIDINFGYTFFDSNLCDYLMYCERYEIVATFPLTKLMDRYKFSSYFECILKAHKDGKIDKPISELFNRFPSGCEVLFFNYLASYGYASDYKVPIKDYLLKTYNFRGRNKTLLEHLLDLNRSANLYYVKDLLSDVSIIAILTKYGIFLDNKVNIDLIENQESDYDLDVNNISPLGPIPEEGAILLDRLAELFNSHGESELVFHLIDAYRESLIYNYEYTLEELKSLVYYKENNPNINIDKGNSSFYDDTSKKVVMNTTANSVLLHECAHLLHDFQGQFSAPQDLDRMMAEVANDQNKLYLIEQFILDYKKNVKKIKADMEIEWDKFSSSYINDTVKSNIEEFLQENKNKTREKLKELKINDIVINVILNRNYNFNRYMETLKKDYINSKVDVMLDNYYYNYRAIFDILDAIFDGKLHTTGFINKNGKNLGTLPGHGVVYYAKEGKKFVEIIANYSTLIKSRDSENDLELLRNLIGDELFYTIHDYYINNLANSELLENNVTISV